MRSKGIEFEERALVYLRWLFEEMGFGVTEARQQDTGTQNGFDIKIGFIDDAGRGRSFYFECKEYTTRISWDAVVAKIGQVDASGHMPDGYIAISPHVDFSNVHVSVLEKQQSRVRFPIGYWAPSTNVAEYFAADDAFYEYVYGAPAVPGGNDKAQIIQKVRGIVVAMLARKDQLAAEPAHRHYPKELTDQLPRMNAADIIGRADELDDLHGLLFNDQRVVVVNGLGGIGKTTLAEAYASKYYDSYRHIVWISQKSQDIENDIISAGLTENLSVARAGKEPADLFRETIRGLKALPDGPNLLILDNAGEQLSGLKDQLPGPPQWHVLTTSRTRIEGFYPRELGFLKPEAAIALFRKHCPRIGDEEVADLVRSIDYHTLTIEILAKVAQSQRKDIATLKQAIKADLKANVYIPHSGVGKKIERVRSYLSSIFNLSSLSAAETRLMKQFVCLPADYHSYDLLLELIGPDDVEGETLAEVANRLVELGWLLYNNADAYKMHVVVQDVAREQLGVVVDDVDALLRNVTIKMDTDESKENPVDKFQWMPFGKAILDTIGDTASNDIGVLQNNLALVLQDLGQYEQARNLLQKAMLFAERYFGSMHHVTATRYSNLASVFRDLGQYDHALELLEKAVLSAEQYYGHNDPVTAVRYSNLALVLQVLGRYEEARSLLEKAMVSAERNFGPDHPTTAVYYSNLALVLPAIGESELARELLQKAMLSTERNFGNDHPATAIVYSNLAAVLKDLGQNELVRDLLEKSLRCSERSFGTDHPTTALRYSNLAVVLRDLAQYGEALILAKKSLEIFQRTFSEGHPKIDTVQGIVDWIIETSPDLSEGQEVGC